LPKIGKNGEIKQSGSLPDQFWYGAEKNPKSDVGKEARKERGVFRADKTGRGTAKRVSAALRAIKMKGGGEGSERDGRTTKLT